jgi:hypothetical protein
MAAIGVGHPVPGAAASLEGSASLGPNPTHYGNRINGVLWTTCEHTIAIGHVDKHISATIEEAH